MAGIFAYGLLKRFTTFLAISSVFQSLDFVSALPTLQQFPVINLHEDFPFQTPLVAVNCTDPEGVNNQCSSCNIIKTNTPDANFFFNSGFSGSGIFNYLSLSPFDIQKPGSGVGTFNNLAFIVVFSPANGHDLDYRVIRTYLLDIQCEGRPGNFSKVQTLEIDLLPNLPPIIQGLPEVTESVNALQGIGTTIATVVVDNRNETDTLTYIMTVDPPTADYFQISPSGVITATKHLQTVTVNPVTIQVNVSDGKHTVGPLTITVTFTSLNDRPRITNLPMNVTINEDAPGGTSVATLTFSDFSGGVTSDPTFSVSPVSEASKFRYIPGSNLVRLETFTSGTDLLDAERVNRINLSFVLDDGFLQSIDSYIIVTVANINEPPFFDKTTHFCTLLEGNSFGSACDLDLTIRDPEGDVLLSPSLNPTNNTNNAFSLQNGDLRISNTYSVDGGLFPSAVTLTIEVEDEHGATGSSLIQVTVLDQNTQTPDFGGSPTSFLITADILTPPVVIAQITATDADLTSPNNRVRMQSSSVNLGSNVVFNPNDGRITYLNRFPKNKDCSDCRLEIIAFDEGTPPRTATTTFFVGFTTTTSTSTTTGPTTTTTTSTTTTVRPVTTTSNVFLTPEGAAILGLLIALLVLLLLAVLGYFLYRYCKYGTCCGATGPNGQGAICGKGGTFGNCCGEAETRKVTPKPYGPEGGQQRTPRAPQQSDVYKSSGDYNDDFYNTNDGMFERPSSIRSVSLGFRPTGQRALPAPRY